MCKKYFATLFLLPSEALAIKMAMAVGQPVNIMKNSGAAAIFIAKQSAGNKNGYGRRPATKYHEKWRRSGYFLLPCEALAIKMAMAVGRPLNIMKNSGAAAIFYCRAKRR